MTVPTTIQGQTHLPRYFAPVFQTAGRMECGLLDMILPDGRCFRADGTGPGPVAEMQIHHADIFARLIREGDPDFCEACLDNARSTPGLQAFLNVIHAAGNKMYDGLPGLDLLRLFEKAGLQDRVEIKLRDYRDEGGSYEIASSEMFEDECCLPVHFDTLRQRLMPGATVMLQVITVQNRRFGDRFQRMWNMFLASWAAAFRSGITVTRPA